MTFKCVLNWIGSDDIHITECLGWFSNYQLLKFHYSITLTRMRVQFPALVTLVSVSTWLAAVRSFSVVL